MLTERAVSSSTNDRSANAMAPMAVDPQAVNGRRQSIGIVDDDESVRDSLGLLLETLGFAVTAHASAGDFLADEHHRDIDYLIVDQHMPRIDGLSMLGALRDEGVDIPAVLITGRLDPGVATRAEALGVAAVLEKPFSTARLLELVCARLGSPE